MAKDVAIRMNLLGHTGDAILGIGDGCQHFIGHLDSSQSSLTGFGMVSGDRGDGLSAIANSVTNRSEHWLILNDQSICQFAGHISRSDDRCNSIDCIRTRNVNRNNASVRMRTAQSCAPQHVVGPHVTRESEATLNFGDTIWSAGTCAKCAVPQ